MLARTNLFQNRPANPGNWCVQARTGRTQTPKMPQKTRPQATRHPKGLIEIFFLRSPQDSKVGAE
ncbi:MAG: hypothetical protein CBB71_19405 [Rhodopirellula sp. TMED11]|nr:MAG: hypothetical protein CBB71_19405 [Rhodopirellula sp. TMED11]